MSFNVYQVQCPKCSKIYNTSFGIVGTTQIAAPLKKCPTCHTNVVRYDMSSMDHKAEYDSHLCLHCDCNTHHLDCWYDEADSILYMSVEVRSGINIWKRLKEAIKLFLGLGRGCYVDIVLQKEGIQRFRDYVEKIHDAASRGR